MSNRIALSVIAGDDINKDNGVGLRRLIESTKDFVGEIFISFNGKDTETIIELAQLYEDKVTVELTTWNDDFAFARNQAFDMIPKDQFDWIMWADSDDTVEGLHSIDSMLDSLDSKTQAVMLKYDYATDEATGEVLAEQWRERLFRTDLSGTWIYPLHELYRLPFGTQIARRGDVWVKHWREEPRGELVRNDGTRERNRRILTKAMRENPDDTRLSYYFANEIYAEAAIAVSDESIPKDEADAICDAAIVAYENFIPEAPSPDDAYIATHQIAELFRLKGAFLQSIDTDMQAMMILPHWPEAWVGVAQSYLELKDWDKAIFFAEACLKVTTNPETTQVREPLAGKYLPLLVIAIAQENKGEYRSAIDTYNDLIEFDRDNELSNKIAELKLQLKSKQEAEAAVPEVSLRDKMYGTSPEKSIAFFLRPSVEEWSSRSMKEGGIGGTETAVCEVAKRFADKGWRTVIFGSPQEDVYDTVYDGIEWYNSTDLSLTEEFTVFVSLRTPEVFDANLPAKLKVLWMHDVNCLFSDTEVATLDGGKIKIKDMKDNTWIYSCDENGNIVPALASPSALSGENVPMVRVKLDNHEWVDCTPDHPFMLRDGSYKEAQFLEKGESLMPLYRKIRSPKVNTKKPTKRARFVEHVKHPNGDWEYTHRMVMRKLDRDIEEGEVVHHKDENPLNNIPDNLEIITRSDHNGLHASENVEHLTKISRQRWGLEPREDGTTYRDSVLSPEEFSDIVKKAWITRKKNDEVKVEEKVGNNHKVVEVVEIDNGDVYDLNVPKYGNFALASGVFVHNTGQNFIEPSGKNRVDNIDIIAGVSKWHCSHMRKLYDIPEEKLVVLPNGINLERFLGKEVERQSNRYIWSSSPDRGLDVVLDMWPEIRKIQPDAELNIYYGWNNYDKVVEYTQDYWMKIFKDGIFHRLEDLKDHGVTWHGRIDQYKLAEEFMKSEYQFYPGYFLETNFIGGLEAQAGGCIPIISNAGGAVENMSEAAVLLDGWPNNFTYRKEALRKIKELTKLDEQVKEDDRKIMKEFVQYKTWDRQFANWLSLVDRVENV